MDTTIFTPIMVIGTILALIFAAGALWNSLARRKHLALTDPDTEKEERIVFKPMPDAPPTETDVDDAPAPKSKAPHAHTPLFRQVRPTGVVESGRAEPDEEELYVWE